MHYILIWRSRRGGFQKKLNKISKKIWWFEKKGVILQSQRAISAAGLEHLPYKQRVGGSNPSSPTIPTIPTPVWSFGPRRASLLM